MNIIKSTIFTCLVLLATTLLTTPAIEAKTQEYNSLLNVITVSPRGGDHTNVTDALASTHNASQANPYIILVGPGTYKVRSRMIMKPYVSMRGSGKSTTTLVAKVRGSTASLIDGARDSQVEDLSIILPRNSNFPSSTAMRASTGCTRLKNVDITVNAHASLASAIGIQLDTTDCQLEDVDLFVSHPTKQSIGIVASLASATIKNSNINANISMMTQAQDGGFDILGSTIIGPIVIDEQSIRGQVLRVESSTLLSANPIEIRSPLVDGVEAVVSRSRISHPLRTAILGLNCLYSDDGRKTTLNRNCTAAP